MLLYLLNKEVIIMSQKSKLFALNFIKYPQIIKILSYTDFCFLIFNLQIFQRQFKYNWEPVDIKICKIKN